MKIQRDGRLVAAGWDDGATIVVPRFGADGGIDTTFGSLDGYDLPDADIAGGLALQPNGKMVVGSTVGTGDAMLLRYTTGGSLVSDR